MFGFKTKRDKDLEQVAKNTVKKEELNKQVQKSIDDLSGVERDAFLLMLASVDNFGFDIRDKDDFSRADDTGRHLNKFPKGYIITLYSTTSVKYRKFMKFIVEGLDNPEELAHNLKQFIKVQEEKIKKGDLGD